MTTPTTSEILVASLGWAAYGTQEAPPPEVADLDADTRQALWTEANGLCDVIRAKVADVYVPDK